MPDHPAAGEIVTTRALDAPREVVFRAFTDPGRLARWWGPKGFTNTFHEFDPRPGGKWRFVMRGPDGTDYPMANDFVEVEPPERIVLRHIQEGHGFRLTIGFSDEAGGTRVDWRMRFDSAAEADRVREIVAAANEENLDRLEDLLADEPPKIRKQYYFRPSANGFFAWDVDRLIALSAGFPVHRVPLSEIRELDEPFHLDDAGDPPTGREIAEHARLVREADLAYPIILAADGRVMDGMHRVMKALAAGLDAIDVVRFEGDPEPDHVDVRPEDLPY